MIMDSTTEVVLKKLEETQNEYWNVARSTGNFLNMLIKISGSKNAYEIGTSNGYSGIWLSKALKENGGHLTTIEFYEKRKLLAEENFKICGGSDVITTKEGSAIGILERLPEDEVIDLAIYTITKERIEKIHKKGKLRPLEAVYMWESFDLCIGGSKSISLEDRCEYFKQNCHECLMELSQHKLKHDKIEFSKSDYVR